MSDKALSKIINFQFENDTFRYKFWSNEPVELIDTQIRRRFKIPLNTNYFLLDTSDATNISLYSLIHLDDSTNVRIEILDDSLSRKNDSTNVSNPASLIHMVKDPNRDVLSFSDNNIQLKISDLSSTSESENDSKSTLNYHCMVPHTGTMKMTVADVRKKNVN